MNKDVDNLKIVKIMDAAYCVRCDFAYVADVLLTDGNRKKMFYCARKDCDNWKTTTAEASLSEMEQTVIQSEEPIAEGWEVD